MLPEGFPFHQVNIILVTENALYVAFWRHCYRWLCDVRVYTNVVESSGKMVGCLLCPLVKFVVCAPLSLLDLIDLP